MANHELAQPETLGKYAKGVAQVVGATLAIFLAAMTGGGDGDERITAVEQTQIAAAIVTALLVYVVPNFPAPIVRYAKTAAAVLGAIAVALPPYLEYGWSGLDGENLSLVALQVLTALGVYIAPNTTPLPVIESAGGGTALAVTPVEGSGYTFGGS